MHLNKILKFVFANKPDKVPPSQAVEALTGVEQVDKKSDIIWQHYPETVKFFLDEFEEESRKKGVDSATLEMQRPLNLEVAQERVSDWVQNVRVTRESITDALSQIYNRGAFERMIETEISRCHRYDKKMSMIMLDIDHFKVINDTFGHQTGDEAIRMIAKILKSNTRDADIVARYGGEEFAILLPETDLEGARGKAESLVKLVEQKTMEREKKSGKKFPKFTISAGIAELNQKAIIKKDDEEETIKLDNKEWLIAAADTALYQSKESGRNKATTYNENTILGEKKAA